MHLLYALAALAPFAQAQNTTLSTLSSPSSSQSASTSSSASTAPPVPTQTSKPFQPVGGVGVNASEVPIYTFLSDFDFQSLNLALNQEWIELDLFHHGLATFSDEEFEAAGLNAEDRFLIEWMADQEVGHATMLSNILGPNAAKQCNYTYPFTTVQGFVDFCQKLTRFGEAGVYGFLPHLDSRPSAELLLQSITTEARQQMIFRQFEGAFPMPVWFETGIPQSMAWTLLSPYITSCPKENPHIVFQNFPGLNITNNPSLVPLNNSNSSSQAAAQGPAITRNRTTSLSQPGRVVELEWELPGKVVGYDGLYTTNTTATGPPAFVAWIAQLNTTYTPLNLTAPNATSGTTIQPNGTVFGGNSAEIINGTIFIAITDSDLFVTPFNLSLINDHVIAGPALYQSG